MAMELPKPVNPLSDVEPRTSNPGPQFNRRDLGPISLLVASMIGMFWKVVFTSQMFFYRDVSNYTYPSTKLIREIVRQGHLPYWNPYLNYGQHVG